MEKSSNFQWSLAKTLRITAQFCFWASAIFLGRVVNIVFISGKGVGWQCLIISVLALVITMTLGYFVLLHKGRESKESFLLFSLIILVGTVAWPFYIRSYYPVEELISLDAREMLLWSSIAFYFQVICSTVRQILMTGPERVLDDALRILEANN